MDLLKLTNSKYGVLLREKRMFIQFVTRGNSQYKNYHLTKRFVKRDGVL